MKSSISLASTAETCSGNLWDQAYFKLRRKDQESISFEAVIDPQTLLDHVQEKWKECVDKQWTIPLGGTRGTIKLRDVFAKITIWIEKLVKVGDVAMQYDPGHAALPWAVVRFLLQVSVNDVQRYAVVLEGIEVISNILVRYEIYTALYLCSTSNAADKMRSVVVELYASVLAFLAKAKRYYSQNTSQRIMKSFAQFAGGYQKLLNEIARLQKDVDRCAYLLDAEFQQQTRDDLTVLSTNEEKRNQQLRGVLGDLQKPIGRMEKQVAELHDNLMRNERQQVLELITTQPYLQHHYTANRDVLKGTGMWLLKDELLVDWQKSSASSILWLHGILGSGKTKLVSILVEQLMDDFRRGVNPQPAYFYCTRNVSEKDRSDPGAILACLVKQLACAYIGGPIIPPVLEKFEEKTKQASAAGPLSLEESTELIIASTAYRPLTIILIDALDECERTTRMDLLEALQQIIHHSPNLVKVFVSSREDQDIVCHLTDCPNVKIDATKNQTDIVRFVESEVGRRIARKELLLGNVTLDLVSSIKETLCNGAHGMFRWVELQLQYMCSLKTDQAVQDRLGLLLSKLATIYEEIYSSNIGTYGQMDRTITERIFRWILCCQQQPRPALLRDAVLMGRGTLSVDTILDLSCNLVVHDKELDVFRFAHLSVREYLEKKADYSSEVNHGTAAKACLYYVTNLSGEQVDILMERNSPATGRNKAPNPFSLYACAYWPVHTAEGRTNRQCGKLQRLFREFLKPEVAETFKRWSRVVGSRWFHDVGSDWWPWDLFVKLASSRSLPANPIFVACNWGFTETVKALLASRVFDFDIVANRRGETALCVASSAGHIEIVRLLLDSGVKVNRMCSRGNALYEASLYGNEDVVQLLLERGANVKERRESFGDPLYVASQKGYDRVVDLLLRGGADATMLGTFYYSTALQAASLYGRTDVVRRLLGSGADPREEGGQYGNALQAAAVNSSPEMVKLLLDSGAYVNAYGGEYSTALIAASLFNNIQVVEILLDNDADVNARGKGKWASALISASIFGRGRIAGMLLEKGADVNMQGGEWDNALTAAAVKGHYQIVKILLEEGAKVNVRGGKHGNALQAASIWGQDDTVQLLLTSGADVNFPAGVLGDALQAASCQGRYTIAKLLLANGACVNARGGFFGTALCAARAEKHEGVVQLLLENGAIEEEYALEAIDGGEDLYFIEQCRYWRSVDWRVVQ